MERGVPIRAISRGIAVLSTINRDGPISMMGIARSAQVPYPTACRIVQTLLHEGLIEKEPARKRYRVTSLVQTLSTGFQTEDQLVAAARPHIERLCHEVSWPISVVTRVGPRMMVRDSTHKMTSLTFSNYYPGYTLPIAECATGKIYLAFCDDDERAAIIEGWKAVETEDANMGMLLLGDDYMLSKMRRQGYALQVRNVYNSDPGKTSSIAVPVLGANGSLLGALALIYFASAMSTDEAVSRYLGPLQKTAGAIHRGLAELEGKLPTAEAAE
jgi:IclR family mhp operon transcriptional activator